MPAKTSITPVVLSASLILLTVICLSHLFVSVVWLFHEEIPSCLFVASVPAAIVLVFTFADRLGVSGKTLTSATFLSLLAITGPIQIDYGWFKRATEEKLNNWKIQCTPANLGTDTTVSKLTSVEKGYPNQILYRFK